MAFDIYQCITDRIIAEMENGVIPWNKPWVGGSNHRYAVKHRDGKPYSLLNQFLLGEPGEYLSFKECQAAGGKVKKGEKSKMVVFWMVNEYDRKDSEGKIILKSDGTPDKVAVPILRYYNVFNINQCEGISPKWEGEEPEAPEMNLEPIEEAEKIAEGYLDRSKVQLVHEHGSQAYYSPLEDKIHLPELVQFVDIAEYYSTKFHEMVHSTGHKDRLNRIEKTAAFGNDQYSKEELVAEIGACTILNRLGIETRDSFRNNVAYIQNWLHALRNDKKLIVSAAGRAEKAVNMIFGEAE